MLNSCNDKLITSKYFEPNYLITDGNLNEWDDDNFFSFENNLKIAIGNDKNYVYLAGEFPNRSIGRNFALSGISLLINPSGNKKDNIIMIFYYPGTKKIDHTKGGFFTMLSGDQKIKALRNLEKISNSVFVYDTTELKSLVYTDTNSSPFQGKMQIANNKLSFELKFPLQINEIFESYSAINENSLFCLQPGNLFNQMSSLPKQMNFHNPNGNMGNTRGKPKDIKRIDASDFQFWFKIKKS